MFPVKKDLTRDLLLIFTDCMKQDFTTKAGKTTMIEGRWCSVCRAEHDAALRKSRHPPRPLNKCFLQGANTTCRGHIMRFHFEEYQRQCNAAIPKIPLNHACVPPMVQKEHEEGAKQKKLGFNVVKGPAEFTRLGVLESVAKHTAINNQALMLADKISFKNCLTSMRPKLKSADLPSAHDIRVYIHNAFVDTLNKLKADIEKGPGKVSCMADGWMADTTKLGYLGMTAHWINVEESGRWRLRAEVVGFCLIHGTHARSNLGHYFVGLCDRVGIMSRTHSKHALQKLPCWSTSKNQLPCLEHVCNIASVDVMGHITKIKAIDTTSAIWDYSPGDHENRVLNGWLDVITTIQTLSIKLQSSGQCIQYFKGLQVECGMENPLKLTLHNNTRWGSAFSMLERVLTLRAAINLFVVQADQLYGPITTQQTNGRVTRKIPCTDFALNNADWKRVEEAKTIIADLNRVLHYFSAEKQPTLYCAIPAIENLQTAWEDKLDKHIYALYHDTIRDGLAKLLKSHGADQRNRKPKLQMGILMRRIGYMRLGLSLRMR
ncbi:hypothetical protein DXG01_006651, partial [Tephrocybe rancida]